jgi:predicted RNA binding protein YcfA (HicA-like mRNA interferase family)
MPPLRALHWRTVEQVLLFLGYEHYRTGGSHRIYIKEGEIKHVTVPKHKAIAPGTLAAIIRQKT